MPVPPRTRGLALNLLSPRWAGKGRFFVKSMFQLLSPPFRKGGWGGFESDSR
jgi:hypothetical protein